MYNNLDDWTLMYAHNVALCTQKFTELQESEKQLEMKQSLFLIQIQIVLQRWDRNHLCYLYIQKTTNTNKYILFAYENSYKIIYFNQNAFQTMVASNYQFDKIFLLNHWHTTIQNNLQ